MALETTNLRSALASEVRLPLVDSPVVSQKMLEELKVPREIQEAILKDPKIYNAFFAQQYGRYAEITLRPEIKSLSAEITEPFPAALEPAPKGPLLVGERTLDGAVTDEERKSLEGWIREKGGLLQAASDSDTKKLMAEIEEYLNSLMDDPEVQEAVWEELKESEGENPYQDVTTPDAPPPAINLMADLLNTDLKFEKEEDEKKFQELLLAIAAGGDPDAIALAIAEKYTYLFSQRAGKALAALKNTYDFQDKIRAQVELKGDSLSTADLAKFNADAAKGMMSSNSLFQVLQGLLQKRDSMQTMAQSVIRSGGETLRTMIQNVRAT